MSLILVTLCLLGTQPEFEQQMEQALAELASEYHYDRLAGFHRLNELGKRAIENLAQRPATTLHPASLPLLVTLVRNHPCGAGVRLLLALAEQQDCPIARLRLLTAAYDLAGRVEDLPPEVRRKVETIPQLVEKEFGKDFFSAFMVRLAIPRVIEEINRLRREGYLQGSYPGQFRPLKEVAGSMAQHALIMMLKAHIAKQAKRSWPNAALIMKALADIADASALEEIKKIYRSAPATYRMNLEVVLFRLGEREPLLERMEALRKRADSGDITAISSLVFIAGRAGLYHMAEKYQRIRMARHRAMPTDYYNLACYLAMQNKLEEALAELEKAFKKGYSDLAWLMRDGEIAKVRNHPRFRELLKKYFPEIEGQKKEKPKKENKK